MLEYVQGDHFPNIERGCSVGLNAGYEHFEPATVRPF